jgi:hypothetical protein
MTLLHHWRWMTRGLFFIYAASGLLFFFSLETTLCGIVYVLLLQALAVFSWLLLIAICWHAPSFQLFVSGLAVGVSALLWLQMHNPASKLMPPLEVKCGC